MDRAEPIFTERKECQDCFKCVRECPVKAIRVESACATIVPRLCVACGHCVGVCPSGAKRVRDDLGQAQGLIASGRKVIASLAPSFVSEFAGLRPAQVIRALKELGFWGVSETALGAQRVSGSVAAMLREPQPRLLVSSACPVIVDYLQKYLPAFSAALTPLVSPVLAHCHLLREHYGNEIGIVFISPCIAKKREADAHGNLLDIAITFEDLKHWLEAKNISIGNVTPQAGDQFVPQPAEEGALYPIDGGMAVSVKAGCGTTDAQCMSFSGIRTIQSALDGLCDLPLKRSVFLELLACAGGCVNGPQATRQGATVAKRAQVIEYAPLVPGKLPRPADAPVLKFQAVEHFTAQNYSEALIKECLRSIGKKTQDDEFNCGGCGYDNCREFAKALADGKAEKAMCVTYMRKLAQKKANALIAKTPTAVILADANLKIIECNRKFATLMGAEVEAAYNAGTSLEGTPLQSIVPFHNLFQAVLDTGEDILDRDIRCRQAILHASIFSIEEYHVVCGILQDITNPTARKEHVIQQAQEVIKKNLATVQQIAYLLGENAAESEVTLNSIIESFSNPDMDAQHD
jgi:iron only hydrogenase large subunit-like protein